MDPYGQQLLDIVIKIKNGDRRARNSLVAEYRPFILKTAVNFCRRALEWGRDDELSIGLIAFNSAIDSFDTERQIPFLPYARIVMTNRLRDYFRREARHCRIVPLDAVQEDRESTSDGEAFAAWEQYRSGTIEDERREELERFERLLADYDTGFEDLVAASPRHRDSRSLMFKVARILSEKQELMAQLYSKKQLPLKELAEFSGVKRKTLERGRKFIIASALILSQAEDFIYLRSYIDFGFQSNKR